MEQIKHTQSLFTSAQDIVVTVVMAILTIAVIVLAATGYLATDPSWTFIRL